MVELSENKKSLWFCYEPELQTYIINRRFKTQIPIHHVLILKKILNDVPYEYSDVNEIVFEIGGDDDYLEFYFHETLGKLFHTKESDEIKILLMENGSYVKAKADHLTLSELSNSIVNIANKSVYLFEFETSNNSKTNFKKLVDSTCREFIQELLGYSYWNKWFYFNSDDSYIFRNKIIVPIYFDLEISNLPVKKFGDYEFNKIINDRFEI